MPNIDEIMTKFKDARVFSKLDLKSGFYQVVIPEQYRDCTSFRWGSRLMRFVRMPFGLKNAPAYFCKMMAHEIQQHNLGHCVAVYIDDLIVYSRTAAEHEQQQLSWSIRCGPEQRQQLSSS